MRTSVTSRNPAIRILIVDDHPILRKGLVELFEEQSDLVVAGQAGTIAQALAAASAGKPDVAVVDLTLGHESGLDLLAQLAEAAPEVRVLVLSGHDEQLFAERALKAGALGYVMKDHDATVLMTAVRLVAAGQSYMSADTAERMQSASAASTRDDRSPLERLSDREHHVLTLLGQGLATREIAKTLELSVKTIESHVAHLKEKLGARNGRELVRLAVSWTGALPPPPRGTPSRRRR